MYGALIKFVVKTGMRSEFVEYLRWDAQVARDHEPGTLRFDAWQPEAEPDVVYVYEAYKDAEAFEDHQKNAPFKKFGEVADSMIEEWGQVIPFGEAVTPNVHE
jgi:autoinducer 2-degrading protein